jgi:hypothetical protein
MNQIRLLDTGKIKMLQILENKIKIQFFKFQIPIFDDIVETHSSRDAQQCVSTLPLCVFAIVRLCSAGKF